MGIPCRAATVRGVRCEARPGLTSRASCPAVTSRASRMCWVNQPAVPMGHLVLLTLTAYPAGRLRLAQPRRIVRRRPARRPGRVHGRRSGPVERRRAGRRGDRSRIAGQAQLVSGRRRGPDDPAAGAAGPILGLSTQAASDCSPRQISKPDEDALNSASPGVRTHTDPPVRAGSSSIAGTRNWPGREDMFPACSVPAMLNLQPSHCVGLNRPPDPLAGGLTRLHPPVEDSGW
jgi:hypothetical protein